MKLLRNSGTERVIDCLGDVEHGEALEERNCSRVIARFVRSLLFAVWGEAVEIDNRCAALALSHVAAEA
jgi:hypothetical protein